MKKTSDRPIKELLAVYGPLFALVLVGFVIAFQYIKPAPPDQVVIATGETGGAYYDFALRYQRMLKKEGIHLQVLPTRGSVENLRLLQQGKADMALVQGGVESAGERALEGLGSLYYEPLWLFHQADLDLARLPSLKGLRVAVGQEGSGTWSLVKRLLKDNSLDTSDVALLNLSSNEAARQLQRGEIDAAFFVASAQAPLMAELLHDPGLRPASFQRAGAYARRYPFLTELVLPEGSEDLANNIPAQDIRLLATTSSLVVSEDLHPALISLMMQILEQVHDKGGWFEAGQAFPTPKYMTFPLSEQAERYYKHGAPFLQRYLPFWAASLLDRMKVLILPLLGLLLPMFKVLPPLYRWRMRSRIYRWYRELEEVDKFQGGHSQIDVAALRERLDSLEREVREVKVPLSFSDQLYHLRLHIDFVRRKLD